ncbi:hypothetical protein TNCV_5055121 [Trichonephila clavipes]|nr:hypothetical protein TNCV_5055121 [Trichonephila clavipes]
MGNLILKDRCLTIRETAEQTEISTGSPIAILYDPVQSSCEICSQVSVVGTEKLHLVVAQDRMGVINAQPAFLSLLAVPENENDFERILFSE